MKPELVTFEGATGALVADQWSIPNSKGTILLLHGGGQTRHSWRKGGLRFAEAGWTTVALDARGHGDSDWAPDGDYSAEALIADLAAVVDQLAVEPVLVGASMGGMTSLLAVGEAAVEASQLVLVDVAPSIEPEGVKRIFDFMNAAPDGFGTLDEVADAIAAYNPHRQRSTNLDGLKKNVRQRENGRWYWHWDPRFLSGGDEPSRQAQMDRLTAAARNVSLPTLLVRGAQSDVVSVEGAKELKQLIPHAVVQEAEAGHMVAGDDNDVFVTQVVEFLDSTR